LYLLIFRRPKEKELELDKVEKTIKKEKDLEVSPSSIEPHLAKLMEPGEVVSKSELVRRSLDSVDGIKGIHYNTLKIKSKRYRTY